MSRTTGGGAAMGLCLQIVHDPRGGWDVRGLPGKPMAHLASLAASIDYARRECAAAPATIELMVDGFYALIHQAPGWPRRIVSRERTPPRRPARAGRAAQPG